MLRADRSAVTGLLAPAGPIHGNALVHLTDKAYFVVGRLLDLVLGHSAEASSAGLTSDRRLTTWAAAREKLLEDHVVQPAVEPLIPALARTVLHWNGEGGDVSIVHDEQSAMTERRIRRLERQLLPPGRALRFRQADSRADPRVQVADVLAGVARRIATDELHGHGDPELTGLLRPYVDPASRWRGPHPGLGITAL